MPFLQELWDAIAQHVPIQNLGFNPSSCLYICFFEVGVFFFGWEKNLNLNLKKKKDIPEHGLLLSENYNFDTADQTRCQGRILPSQFAE